MTEYFAFLQLGFASFKIAEITPVQKSKKRRELTLHPVFTQECLSVSKIVENLALEVFSLNFLGS
jgi:hypothetical protein